MRKIIGDFDMKLAEIYADLIDECVSGAVNLRQKFNGEHVVLFPGIHVVKHPHPGDREQFPARLNGLVREFEIGRGLDNIGLNVPRMHLVGVNDSEIPFLIMDRLNLTNLWDLNSQQRKEAQKQYFEQIDLAKNEGYFPGDVGDAADPYNCGFDVNKKKLFFYDFTDWRMN